MTEASRATGINRRSLREDIRAGRFVGAYRESTAKGPSTGRWRIPIDALARAGYELDVATFERDAPLDEIGELHRLRVELDNERAQRRAAEARVAALEELMSTSEPSEVSGASALNWQIALRQRTGMRGNWLR